jgi:beta-barrel assembly-enhancing protease
MIIHRASMIAVSAVLFAAFVSCSSDVSTSDEISMGRDYARAIGESYPIVADPGIGEYVSRIGRTIAVPQDGRHLEWQFQFVNVTEPNAFAIPGGFVYVTRGMVERMDTMSELAGIMGHEISHVVRRHSVKQMVRVEEAQRALVIACLITGRCADLPARLAIEVGGELLFAQHSQADENEADSDAVEFLVAAGIHPGGIPAMFTKLLAERERGPTPVEAWFSSHPTEQDRVTRTQRAIAMVDPAVLGRLRVDESEFHTFLARVAELPPARSADEIISSDRDGAN